jgi:hypothetical protein
MRIQDLLLWGIPPTLNRPNTGLHLALKRLGSDDENSPGLKVACQSCIGYTEVAFQTASA